MGGRRVTKGMRIEFERGNNLAITVAARRGRGWLPTALIGCLLWMAGMTASPFLMAGGVYPSETIRLVVPFSRNGATDVIFRDVAARVRTELNNDIDIINIPGAAAIRGASLARDAAPDGHTLLGTHQTLLHSYLSGVTAYSHRQLSPVALLTRTVNIPSTWTGHPVQRADQIADYVASHPHAVRIAVIPYSTSEFFWTRLLQLVGVDPAEVRKVHFPDTASQIAALLAREVDFAMLDMPSASDLYQQELLHPLAVAHSERLFGLPATATLQEQGIAMTHTSDRGLFAPHGTPKDRLDILVAALEKVLADEQLAAHMERDYGSFIDFRPLEEYSLFLEQQLEELSPPRRR